MLNALYLLSKEPSGRRMERETRKNLLEIRRRVGMGFKPDNQLDTTIGKRTLDSARKTL
jgi:hypothetical protein